MKQKGKADREEPIRIHKRLTVDIDYKVDVILVRSPLRFLSDAIKKKRFLEGVVVSVMYFERLGVKRLKEFFESKEVPLKPLEIEKLGVQKILSMLEGFGIINHRIHSLMGEVIKYRNYIVHKLQHPDAMDVNKARETIEKAMECLEGLGAK